MNNPVPGCFGSVMLHVPASARCMGCALFQNCGDKVIETRARLEATLGTLKSKLPKIPKAKPTPAPAKPSSNLKPVPTPKIPLTVREMEMYESMARALDFTAPPSVNPFETAKYWVVRALAKALFKVRAHPKFAVMSRAQLERHMVEKYDGKWKNPATAVHMVRMALNVLVASGYVEQHGDQYRWVSKE